MKKDNVLPPLGGSVPGEVGWVHVKTEEELRAALVAAAYGRGDPPGVEAELRRAYMATAEKRAVAAARAGDTLPLIAYVGDLPDGPLRSYLLDLLLHKVPVPKPRERSVEAQKAYHALALFAGMCEYAGMGAVDAVRYTQDHFRRDGDGKIERCNPEDGQLDDDKVIWRARASSMFSEPGFIVLYLAEQRKAATDTK